MFQQALPIGIGQYSQNNGNNRANLSDICETAYVYYI